MQSDEERTLSNLNVLSAISHNDKIMTKDDSFDIYVPTTLRGLVRMWQGERRDHNIDRIRHTVRAAITFATKTFEEVKTLKQSASQSPFVPNPNLQQDHMMQWRSQTVLLQHNRMVDALRDSMKGLQNLLTTYRDDAALSSRIVLIQREIEDFLRVIRADGGGSVGLSSGVTSGASVMSPFGAATAAAGIPGVPLSKEAETPFSKPGIDSSADASPSSTASVSIPERCPSPLSIEDDAGTSSP